MAKSRLAAGLLLIAWQAEADAATTAEQAMARYRRAFRPVSELRCPKSASAEDIVVCGRREGPDPNRVPFPEAREPGERVHLIPGEPPSAMAALNAASGDPCAMVGPNHPCGGSMTIMSLGGTSLLGGFLKVVRHLTGGDD
ncbi:MAG: hypothetical protein QOJ94_1334 [Sphingomonadales bacterium]|jgi:hypothetical protein|nr:hypothetical protein [Sphingomonadales bacterium]